jgi:hypothetical protein
MDDEGGGGYKAFSRYGGGDRRDGRDMRGSYRRSPFRSYGNDFSRNQQEPPPPPPPRRSPLRSVAVPIYDAPGNRVDRGDRENLSWPTPWRRRENRSEAAAAAGAGHMSAGQSTRPAASEKEVPAHPSALTSPRGVEEEAPRKKPRLGWGQGLAKYEKQKVQGPTDPAEAVADVSPTGAGHRVAIPAPVLCASPVDVPPPPPLLCASPLVLPPPPPALCASPVAVPPPAPSPVGVPSSPSARCTVALPSPACAPLPCASPVAVPARAHPPCVSLEAVPSPAQGMQPFLIFDVPYFTD